MFFLFDLLASLWSLETEDGDSFPDLERYGTILLPGG